MRVGGPRCLFDVSAENFLQFVNIIIIIIMNFEGLPWLPLFLSWRRYYRVQQFIFSIRRNIGMGTSTSAARVGSFLSPYIVYSVSITLRLLLSEVI